MKKILISLMMLFIAVIIHADSTSFDMANKLFAEKKYAESVTMYEEILENEGVAPELYYNLGNAYFRLNELAKSILNYERALRLSPQYADAKHNLEFANMKVIDHVELMDTFFLKKWISALMKLQSSNAWFITAVFFFVFAMVSLLIFIFGGTKFFRKASFYIGVVCLIISITSVTFSGIRKVRMLNHQDGIIISGVVVIKGAPDRSGTDLFQLHEGTKVSVVSALGDWYEIKLGSGSIGWVEIKHVEKI